MHIPRVRFTLTDPEDPSLTATGPLTNSAWTNATGSAIATVTAHDPGSGVAKITVVASSPGRPARTVLNASAPCDTAHTISQPGRAGAICPATFTTTVHDDLASLPECISTYTATATDYAGRTHTTSWPVRIDRTPPTALTATGLPGGWVNGKTPVAITASATDALSGVTQLRASVLGLPVGQVAVAPPTTSVATPLMLDLHGVLEGEHDLRLAASDQSANTASAPVGRVRIDRTPPTITHITTQRSGNHTAITDVQARDTRSGLAAVQARVAGSGTWQTLPPHGAVHYTQPGTLYLQVRALDNAGNASGTWSLAVVPDGTKTRTPTQTGPVSTCINHPHNRTCNWHVPKPAKGGYNTIRNGPHDYLIGTSVKGDTMVMRFPTHGDYPPAYFKSAENPPTYTGCGYSKVQWPVGKRPVPVKVVPNGKMHGCDTLHGKAYKDGKPVRRVPPYSFAWMFQRDWVNPIAKKDSRLLKAHCHRKKNSRKLTCDNTASHDLNIAVEGYHKALRASATLTLKRPAFIYRNAFPGGFAKPEAATVDERARFVADFSASAHPVVDDNGHRHPENVGYQDGMIPAGTTMVWRYITTRNPVTGAQFVVGQVNQALSEKHWHIFGRGLSWFFVPVEKFAPVGKPGDPLADVCQQPRKKLPFPPAPTTTPTSYGKSRDLPNRVCQPVQLPSRKDLLKYYGPHAHHR